MRLVTHSTQTLDIAGLTVSPYDLQSVDPQADDATADAFVLLEHQTKSTLSKGVRVRKAEYLGPNVEHKDGYVKVGRAADNHGWLDVAQEAVAITLERNQPIAEGRPFSAAINAAAMSLARDQHGVTNTWQDRHTQVSISAIDLELAAKVLTTSDSIEAIDSEDRVSWLTSKLSPKTNLALAKKLAGYPLSTAEHKLIYAARRVIKAAQDAERDLEAAIARSGLTTALTQQLDVIHAPPGSGYSPSIAVMDMSEDTVERAHENATPVRLGRAGTAVYTKGDLSRDLYSVERIQPNTQPKQRTLKQRQAAFFKSLEEAPDSAGAIGMKAWASLHTVAGHLFRDDGNIKPAGKKPSPWNTTTKKRAADAFEDFIATQGA